MAIVIAGLTTVYNIYGQTWVSVYVNQSVGKQLNLLSNAKRNQNVTAHLHFIFFLPYDLLDEDGLHEIS